MTLQITLLILLLIFLLEHMAGSLGSNSKYELEEKGQESSDMLTNKYLPSESLPEIKQPTYSQRVSRRSKRHTKRKSYLVNKWNFSPLQTEYDANRSHRSIKDDTDPYDLKMGVDGFQVKVISSPKYRHFSNIKESEEFKTGHTIDIIPNTKSESISEELDCDEDIQEEKSEEISLTPETSQEPALDSGLFVNENIIELQEGSGELLHANSVEDSEKIKSSRLVDVFFRSGNLTSCKTPSGEDGHCKRITECLLSDALSNFSLFLQYLCLMRGPFVGICCPDNPVIETKDTPVTTVEELKQPQEGCGKNSNLRIVGGKVSLPHEWTWMVALLRRNRFFCGGVIINDWYILTAAHCVLGLKVKDLTVRLGEYNFSEKNQHQRDIPIAEIKRHAQFVTLTFQHDIALLKLKRKVEYSKFIGSICLPESSRNYSDVNATVVGWGTVSFGGAASNILRQVTVPVWSNEKCDKTYVLESITDSFMCAGSPENGEDACQGDSGGPLMALNTENRWEVIGIVSWGRRCGDPTYPGVYTRVSTYLDWIQQNMN
ncbi:proclotting enzyme isoform X1 [Parasteatoda tepidariorum]|uniref:proclotting enzyme isoform X1 n=2 Tax=Parasteatoda tepidariorum TaxID=114398 RepID=UPI001C72745A|nr:proclotting enzyme isoform X1 [Parasteatoda tepidariorum]